MNIANILVVSPPNYNHQQAFFDIALSFQYSLKQLGIEVNLTSDPANLDEGTTLVFGSHLISKFEGAIDGDYILYQSEQLGANDTLFADDKYLALLKRFPVWDYSQNNIDFLAAHEIRATHVPIGYSRSLSNIKTGRSATLSGKQSMQRITYEEWSGVYPPTGPDGKFIQDIDVCFFGSVNDRRNKILEELRAMEIDGKPITVASFVGYGGFRDKIIARSKIVLNMHYYDTAIFEIFRCAHLFANKKCVVSEFGNDEMLEQPFYQTNGGFANYDALVGRCVDLLSQPAERERIGNKTFELFSKTNLTENLKNVIG